MLAIDVRLYQRRRSESHEKREDFVTGPHSEPVLAHGIL